MKEVIWKYRQLKNIIIATFAMLEKEIKMGLVRLWKKEYYMLSKIVNYATINY
jgi:hypothetical protein